MLQCLANSSRTQGRQAGHNEKTVAIDWFLKKAKLNDIFCTFFFLCIFLEDVNFVNIWPALIFTNAV